MPQQEVLARPKTEANPKPVYKLGTNTSTMSGANAPTNISDDDMDAWFNGKEKAVETRAKFLAQMLEDGYVRNDQNNEYIKW